MGLFKKIKKAISKVTKAPLQAVGLAQDMPNVPAPEAPAPAQQVETPKDPNVDVEEQADTESARRKARSGGKKSLSVSRNSGSGINL